MNRPVFFAPSRAVGSRRRLLLAPVAFAAALACLAGCASLPGGRGPVLIENRGANAISLWNEIAVATATLPPAPAGATLSERTPGPDVVTVQLAVYDAVIATAGTHQPYAVRPSTDPKGASPEAAAVSAAYRTLKGLFPSRGEKYEAAYATAVAGFPAGDATTRGLAIGAEVAAGMLAQRARDGRDVALPPYVPGTSPGRFRGLNPIGRPLPYIQPFATTSHAQFRPPPPPELTSDRYRADLEEVQTLGAATGSPRTAAQTGTARFHTENPSVWTARNLRRFATANESLADNARLLAMLWVATSDAVGACFEAKYHHDFWRPASAIPFAAGSGTALPWAPVVPTPNHPEYPAAHSCNNGAIAATLEAFYGTAQVSFTFDSTATGTTHTYRRTDDLVGEVSDARVWGGMHFRNSTEVGAALGRRVAGWVARQHFRPVD